MSGVFNTAASFEGTEQMLHVTRSCVTDVTCMGEGVASLDAQV